MVSSVLEEEVHEFIQVILTFNSKGLQKNRTTQTPHLESTCSRREQILSS